MFIDANKHIYINMYFFNQTVSFKVLLITRVEISQHFWSWKFSIKSWTAIGRHVFDPEGERAVHNRHSRDLKWSDSRGEPTQPATHHAPESLID